MSRAPSVSFELISKIAQSQSIDLDESHAPAVIHGFMDSLQKQAGLSYPESLGMVRFFAELGGMPKEAINLTSAANLAGNVLSAGALPRVGTAISNIGSSISNTANNVGNAVVNKGKEVLRGVGGEIQAGMAPGQREVISGGIKDLQTATQDTVRKIPNSLYEGAKETGGKILEQAKGFFGNNESLKRMAPYAIAGLGTFLGSKLLGAGTGTALAAGAAGAMAGGYGYQNWDKIKQSLQPATTPAPAPAPAPAPTAMAPAASVVNSQNADEISKRVLSQGATPQSINDDRLLHGQPYQPLAPDNKPFVYQEQVK